MNVFDFIMLLFLIGLLGTGGYLYWTYFYSGEPISRSFDNRQILESISGQTQFYNNMRYPDKSISYSISDRCDEDRGKDAIEAFQILESKTILSFYQDQNSPQISILCSNLVPEASEKNHFVAGEGGPSEVINLTNYAVIFSGKVSLFSGYEKTKCDKPNVALHEILHALGFDHNSNQNSIMYPISSCDQEIDSYLVEEINKLYSVPSATDLVLEKVDLSKKGRYINFKASISNLGFKNSEGAVLVISNEGKIIKEFELESIDIGVRKLLEVENVVIPLDSESLTFSVETEETEITKNNNKAEIVL